MCSVTVSLEVYNAANNPGLNEKVAHSLYLFVRVMILPEGQMMRRSAGSILRYFESSFSDILNHQSFLLIIRIKSLVRIYRYVKKAEG